MVEASIPIRSPLIRPCSARRSSTQANTASCTSSGSRERVLLNPEWSGTGSGRAQPQELAEREAVGAAPLEAALAVDALEVADQVHAEVAARRQRRPAPLAGVVGRALPLGEAVEPGLDQDRLQPVVEGVPRRARQLRPAEHQ